MIQELGVLLKEAVQLNEQITTRLKAGDSALDLVNRLVAQTTIIKRYLARIGDNLTDDCKADFERLLTGVQVAVETGNGWLNQAAGPELARETLRGRLSRAYGLPPPKS